MSRSCDLFEKDAQFPSVYKSLLLWAAYYFVSKPQCKCKKKSRRKNHCGTSLKFRP